LFKFGIGVVVKVTTHETVIVALRDVTQVHQLVKREILVLTLLPDSDGYLHASLDDLLGALANRTL
jgi:hypothetical protein